MTHEQTAVGSVNAKHWRAPPQVAASSTDILCQQSQQAPGPDMVGWIVDKIRMSVRVN